MSRFDRHEERFIENINLVMDLHNQNDADHWIEIKLMTPPGWLDRAIEFKNKLNIQELTVPGKNGRMKGCCSLVPIRDSNGLVKYTDEELNYFKEQ